MKIDFGSVLKTLWGDPIQTSEGNDKRPMLLRDAAITALMQPMEHEDGVSKFKCFNLAKRIHDQVEGELELEPAEAEFIKTRIGQSYGANVVGPSFVLLNG
jgi:hypothetical protein